MRSFCCYCSVAKLYPTLQPHGLQHTSLLSFTISQSLLKLMSIESVMPSNHLILCTPFSSCPQSFPASVSLPVSWLYASGGQSIGGPASASVLPMNLISFRIDWFDLFTVQGTFKSLSQHHNSKASILWCSFFFMVQVSHQYMTAEKTIALTIQTFVNKAMSLIFNTLPRFVIAFLSRSMCLLISWLQSLSAVILKPKKIKSTIYFFPYLPLNDRTGCHNLSFLNVEF